MSLGRLAFFYITDTPTPQLSAVVKIEKDLYVEVFKNSPSSGFLMIKKVRGLKFVNEGSQLHENQSNLFVF